jgi:hypothetical protein
MKRGCRLKILWKISSIMLAFWIALGVAFVCWGQEYRTYDPDVGWYTEAPMSKKDLIKQAIKEAFTEIEAEKAAVEAEIKAERQKARRERWKGYKEAREKAHDKWNKRAKKLLWREESEDVVNCGWEESGNYQEELGVDFTDERI